MLGLRAKRYLRRPGRYDAVVVDVARFPYMGFGATVAWVHMAQVAADAMGMPLRFVNPAEWQFGGRRPECALDRFLEIPVGDPNGTRRADFVPGDDDNMRRWGYFDELDSPHCAFGYRDGFGEIEDYRRALLARHYAPAPFAREAVASRLEFLPASYVAWHVRRGDKVRGPNKEDQEVSLERYVEATAELLEGHPARPRHLVICTDSQDVIEEATRSDGLRRLELEVVFDPTEKRWDGYCDIQRSGGITSTEVMVEETLTAQKILEILRRADVLVGANSSYLFRVPAMLSDAPRASLSENKVYRRYYPI